jgi:hypothetical protein
MHLPTARDESSISRAIAPHSGASQLPSSQPTLRQAIGKNRRFNRESPNRQLTISCNPCIMFSWNAAQFHGSRLAQPDSFSSITPAPNPRLIAEAQFHQAQETIFLTRILTALGALNSRTPEFE